MEGKSNDQGQKTRIIFLDYLRIFAFISVLIGHKFYFYVIAVIKDQAANPLLKIPAKMVLPVITGGGAGVVVFFLVSGYIITHVLQSERVGEFFIKRIFRIYPLYIVAVFAEYISLMPSGHAPGVSTLLPQLFLVGDFFATPYALNGVEWTLRVEIMFYIFMAGVRFFGILHGSKKFFPFVLLVTTLLCRVAAPFPSTEFGKGFLTIYIPFLFIGAAFYLFEKRHVGLIYLTLFIGLVFYQYYSLLALYQRFWMHSYFAVIAVFIFAVLWVYRRYLGAGYFILLLSDMTYAVYLFHNWFFDIAKNQLARLKISLFNHDIEALIVLLLVCFLLVKFIEKPSIRWGRMLARRLMDSKNQV